MVFAGWSTSNNLILARSTPILNLLLGDSAKLVLEGQKVKSINLKNNLPKFKYPLLEKAISSLTKK